MISYWNICNLVFPSLCQPGKNLISKNTINHFSARQHPDAIREYLDMEISKGAMLGPLKEINSDKFHCSPLLTRPKPEKSKGAMMHNPTGDVEAALWDKFVPNVMVAQNVVERNIVFGPQTGQVFRRQITTTEYQVD